ncbi:MAG: FAD-dependent oxidoreductase [Proteobacteria bacterium]|nr:FAD-dependent oxidoreductase [Pseudomonadota bacterium]
MEIVIIGGDAAGMSAASKIKRNRPEIKVTVLEKTEDVSYSACGMPYNIADQDREIEDLVVREASAFREKQGINLLTGHKATHIDPSSKNVSGVLENGKSFEFSYDKLVVATGGSPVVPELPGFDLPGVKVLKSLDDGRKLKAYIKEKKVRKAVIIGMGYIGLEMCEALYERSVSVSMVKPNPMLLPWMAEELSSEVGKELALHNVTLHTGYGVEKITSVDDRIKVICKGLTLETDMAIVAMGIKPNSELAVKAGLETSIQKAISVDKFLKTSDENIYAAGDCADAYHVVTGNKTWIPLALRANRSGWAVADNICGNPSEIPGIAGTAVFKVFDMDVARTGLTEKEAEKARFEPVSVTIKSRSRAHAHPGSSTIWVHMTGDKKTGRLIGVQMVGREGVAHRINAAAVALHSQMTVQQFSETDLAYAPPFGPVWDPLLTASNQLLKKM